MAAIVRAIDYQGRITLPKETLRALGIETGTEMEVWADQDPDGTPVLYLRPYEPGCWLCGNRQAETTETLHGRRICRPCLVELEEIVPRIIAAIRTEEEEEGTE